MLIRIERSSIYAGLACADSKTSSTARYKPTQNKIICHLIIRSATPSQNLDLSPQFFFIDLCAQFMITVSFRSILAIIMDVNN